MASQVSICNLALGWLGANLITSLNDDNREAQLCKTNYDDIRDAVLEEREWTFAVRRLTLPPMVLQPVYGYRNQFLLPNDVLRLLNVPNTQFTDPSAAILGGGPSGIHEGPDQQPQLATYRVESIESPSANGTVILANTDRIICRVIWRVTNIDLYSPLFIQALAARIAADLTIPLTQNRALQRDMWQLYERKLNRASAMDGIQGRMEIKRSNAVQRVR